MTLSQKALKVNWLLAGFVNETPGVEHALAVSSDGLLIALSSSLDRDRDRKSTRLNSSHT